MKLVYQLFNLYERKNSQLVKSQQMPLCVMSQFNWTQIEYQIRIFLIVTMYSQCCKGVSPGAVVQRSDEYRGRQDEERDRLDSSD